MKRPTLAQIIGLAVLVLGGSLLIAMVRGKVLLTIVMILGLGGIAAIMWLIVRYWRRIKTAVNWVNWRKVLCWTMAAALVLLPVGWILKPAFLPEKKATVQPAAAPSVAAPVPVEVKPVEVKRETPKAVPALSVGETLFLILAILAIGTGAGMVVAQKKIKENKTQFWQNLGRVSVGLGVWMLLWVIVARFLPEGWDGLRTTGVLWWFILGGPVAVIAWLYAPNVGKVVLVGIIVLLGAYALTTQPVREAWREAKAANTNSTTRPTTREEVRKKEELARWEITFFTDWGGVRYRAKANVHLTEDKIHILYEGTHGKGELFGTLASGEERRYEGEAAEPGWIGGRFELSYRKDAGEGEGRWWTPASKNPSEVKGGRLLLTRRK